MQDTRLIAHMIEDAMSIIARMPGDERARLRVKTLWPEVDCDPGKDWLVYPSEMRVIRARPSPRQIDAAETVIGWIRKLPDPRSVRLVAGRGLKVPFTVLAREMRVHRNTAMRYHKEALEDISRRLQREVWCRDRSASSARSAGDTAYRGRGA